MSEGAFVCECLCVRVCVYPSARYRIHSTAALKHSAREVAVDEAEDVICARNPKLGIDLLTPPPPTLT